MANATASRRSAPARARVYPVGRAVLFLGVCAGELAGRRVTVDGRRVQTVRYESLALVVAFVDQVGYGEAEVVRKRAEPAWLATEARALERAVDRLAIGGDVLPMKLLTVYPHADALEAAAAERHLRWSRALARLGSKRECTVHVYAGPHVPPGGSAYVARVSDGATRASRMPKFSGDPSTVASLETFWRELTGAAIASRRIAPHPVRGAQFVAALLVAQPDVAAIGALVDRFNVAAPGVGLIAYLEGPRRPFSFVVS